jgi:hypothetical protein
MYEMVDGYPPFYDENPMKVSTHTRQLNCEVGG